LLLAKLKAFHWRVKNMSQNFPAKRRRGGQPGNQNAKGNRGNLNPLRNYGNRGGAAPLNNQNACKERLTPYETLLQKYQHIPEAAEWISLHFAELRDLIDDNCRDRAIYFSHLGLTPESLVQHGLEYQLGVYTQLDEDIFEDQIK
jgi:hypothetical protein